MTSISHLKDCDLAIIGAGPAGMAAAIEASANGAHTVVFDFQPHPGGQIFRNIEANAGIGKKVWTALGPSYWSGLDLVQTFRASSATFFPETTVWHASADGALGLSQKGMAREIRPRQTIIATGAMERAVPIPGWTLPGVMGAGAAQTLLKSGSSIPKGRVILAGSGPLLILVAAQFLSLGVRPEALLLTQPIVPNLKILPSLLSAFRDAPGLVQGLSWLAKIRRAGIPIHAPVSDISAHGDEQLQSVSFYSRGSAQSIEAEHLFLHEGVTPEISLAANAGCELLWENVEKAWRPISDAWGMTSVSGVRVLGDAAGIAGAAAAELSGRVGGLDAACSLGLISKEKRDRAATRIRRRLRRTLAIRPFLNRAFAPTVEPQLESDTLICRCEDISVKDVETQVRSGVQDLNQLKGMTRCGMGPCQGRMCAASLASIMRRLSDRPAADLGLYRPRAPVRPISLSELAEMAPAAPDTQS